MTFHRAISHEPQAENETANPWVMHLCYLAAAWALIFMLLWRDVWAMASTYWNVSTYNHCLLIVPILVWLVQQRREELARIVPVGWVPGLLWIAAAATGWLIGEAAGVAFARQLAVIMLLQGSVITLLGPNVSRGLAFPLFYAFFLVPFGDEFVPALQSITAKLSMVMLDWSNIPAHIEGVFISTPAGLFEVAEACSGVMFLIAMVAYGALVCNLCFISPWRRAAFMAVSVILPIIANGMRAFGTIYIAEFRGIEFAAGFDHIFYGWIFFAVILVLLMAIGWSNT
ncbi:MAG: exosortase A [Parasphingorhabdus sp.]|nr:exosortase A [Parasphingorhabdus sp.]